MARPSGSAEQLAGVRKEALDLHEAGVSIPEIATRVKRTEAAIRRWVRDAQSPDFPVEQLRARVLARLQAESAGVVTKGLHRAWTTEALPWAFGKEFEHGFTGDPSDDLPFDYFVDWLLEWDCYRDDQAIWRAR
jgi:hypothetical protein